MNKSIKTQKNNTENIEKRCEELKSKTYALGDLALGTIQLRWNVCGNPKCKCKKGEKHGPQPYLAFSSKKEKRMISIYLPKNKVPDMEGRLENFQNFREDLEELLISELRIRQKKKK